MKYHGSLRLISFVVILVFTTIGCMKESSEFDHQVNGFDKEFIGNTLYLHSIAASTSKQVPHRSQDKIVHTFALTSDSLHTIASRGIDSVANFINLSIPQKVNSEIEIKAKVLNDLNGRRFDSGYIALQKDYYQHTVDFYMAQLDKGSNAALRNFTSLKLPLFQQQLQHAEILLKQFQ